MTKAQNQYQMTQERTTTPKGRMRWSSWVVLTLALSPCLLTSALRLGADSDSETEPVPQPSVFSSQQKPLLNYRRRALGVRYAEPFTSSPPFQNKYLTKPLAEDVPQYEYDEEEEAVTEEPLETSSTTVRIPAIPAALRRNFAHLTATTSTTTSTTPKPSKTKSTRRRKVKRPPKVKPTSRPKTAEDDLGVPESSKRTNSTGDKNLALEIGSNDGKYALINQFFEPRNETKGPGIVSYAQSDDFANDNDRTLGNLAENDIWLSEGHLLVLKGGDFDSSSKDTWEPIDGYVRDRSKPPLKIPLDTNNPPPFPVFVNESGPPVFLGPPPPFGLPYPPPGYDSGNETFDPSRLPPPGLIPLFPNGTIPHFLPPPPGFNRGNGSFPPFPFGPPGPNNGGFNGPPGGGGGVNQGGRPGGLYGPGNNNGYGYGGGPGGGNGSLPPPPPFFPFGPPGGPPPPGFNGNFSGQDGPFPFLPPLVLNPNDNETDDPSIFLPPPYDFDYHEDNSTLVPPGPFAPGLVVPPPRDFYTVYNRTGSPVLLRPTTPISIVPFNVGPSPALRPQRPNAKRPKFPMTNPPDDSLEVVLPRTTPLPIIPITFSKKRKQRPEKGGKSYPSASPPKHAPNEEEGGSGENPVSTVTERPTILLPPHSRATSSTSPATTPSTPKPKNYVYVRGQLKTLAEIAAEEAAENGFEDGPPTPRPPFDELGYPTRLRDTDNEPIHFEYPRKDPTKEPPKAFYVNTPKYAPNYTPSSYRKKDKSLSPTSYSFPLTGGGGNRIPPSPSPSPQPVQQQQEQPQRQNTNHNNNNQGPVLYYSNNQGQGLGPRYFTSPSPPPQTQYHQQLQPQYVQQQQQPQFVQQQQPPQQPQYVQQQQPQYVQQQQQPQYIQPQQQSQYIQPQQQPQYIQPQQQSQYAQPQQQPQYVEQRQPVPPSAEPYLNNVGPSGGDVKYPGRNAGFRPAFGPQRPRSRSRIIFPGQSPSQPSPPLYNNRVLFQEPNQQQPASGGYYSPISQYRQPIPPSQFVPSAFFPGGTGGFRGFGQSPLFGPQSHFFSPYQQTSSQQVETQQDYGPGSYRNPEEPLVPIARDVLVNYREPLPSYNVESETVTTRSVVTKAGPRPGGIFGTGNEPAGEGSPSLQAGSFYSFQRGGPGGFSYKIQL